VVTWISWGLVAVGVVLVVGAVMSLSGRVRPLRRALRRLSWRRDDLARLQVRAEALGARVGELTADAQRLTAPRAGDTA
jgi:hypothetical protein